MFCRVQRVEISKEKYDMLHKLKIQCKGVPVTMMKQR